MYWKCAMQYLSKYEIFIEKSKQNKSIREYQNQLGNLEQEPSRTFRNENDVIVEMNTHQIQHS